MKKIVIFIAVASALIAAPKTVVAKKEQIVQTKEYAGSVYSHDETMIATRVMGYIKSIKVEEGDRVKVGDLLFEVDPSDIESMQAQAEAGLISAKGLYLDAQRDYDRFKDLFDKGVVPERDFEKMKLNLELREQGLKMAEAALAQAKAQSKYASVRSPIDGIVVAKMAKVAEMAAPGHPVLVLSSTENLRVRAMVQESEIGQIKAGDKATVYIGSINKTIKSEVSSVVPSADAATHSYMIRVNLPKTDGLLPGMYAKVSLDIRSDDGVALPISTVTNRGGIVGVFALEGNVARFLPVTIKAKLGDRVEVGGVLENMHIIDYPTQAIQDGRSVE